jgi:pyrimidine operon attenuation protein/uracil phosphoribosyltransferase
MKNYILTQPVAEKKLRRMAYEILENNAGEQELILAGIRDSGSVIARNISVTCGRSPGTGSESG